MIKRNCFGKLEPSIGKYFVSKSVDGYEILEHNNGTYNAVLKDDVFVWRSIGSFDSLVQAYRFLKENINNLL